MGLIIKAVILYQVQQLTSRDRGSRAFRDNLRRIRRGVRLEEQPHRRCFRRVTARLKNQ